MVKNNDENIKKNGTNPMRSTVTSPQIRQQKAKAVKL